MKKVLSILSTVIICFMSKVALADCHNPHNGSSSVNINIDVKYNNPVTYNGSSFNIICDANTVIILEQNINQQFPINISAIDRVYNTQKKNITYEIVISPVRGIFPGQALNTAKYDYNRNGKIITSSIGSAVNGALTITEKTQLLVRINNRRSDITIDNVSPTPPSPPPLAPVKQQILSTLSGKFSFTHTFVFPTSPPETTCTANSFDVSVSDKEISFEVMTDRDLNAGKIFVRDFYINVLRKNNPGCVGMAVEPILRLNPANNTAGNTISGDINIADSGLLLRITDEKGIKVPFNTDISMGQTTDTNSTVGLKFRAVILKNNAQPNIKIGSFRQVVEYKIIYR